MDLRCTVNKFMLTVHGYVEYEAGSFRLEVVMGPIVKSKWSGGWQHS